MGITLGGSTARTQAFLQKLKGQNLYSGLDEFAQRGVSALEAATPMDTGFTASSWSYEIEEGDGVTSITWLNSNTINGANVVIMLQYGHGTGTGGYVSGQDFINPAIQPIFDEIADDVWKKVTIG